MEVDVLPRTELSILFANLAPESIDSELVEYCNVHDLLAVVYTRTQQVAVFRINGQLAFSIPRSDPSARVTVLKWKPDGSLLGVGFSDGSVGVYSGEDGKLMSLTSVRSNVLRDDWKLDLLPEDDFSADEEEDCVVGCLGWTTYAARPRRKGSVSARQDDRLSIDELYDENENEEWLQGGNVNADPSLSRLTKSLATLDVTTVLPRLSALPIHTLRFGTNEQKFTTQAGLDALLDISRATSESIETFVACGTSGIMNVFLDDSVKLGSFTVDEANARTIYASHPQCSSQVTLSKSNDTKSFNLHYIDLPLESLSGPLLHVVTTNTKRIQNLTAYITQTIRCMQSDLTSNLQLPSRIIQNISEDLSSNGEDDIVTNLFHLAMTSQFTPTMLEWLTETIRENQQKRWDKSVNEMCNSLQNHIFVHLIPALDRLALAANAIRGHAKAHEDTHDFVSPEPFTRLMDDIDSLRLVAQKVQLLVMTEHRQFRAFSKWLRVMIEVGAAGPNTKAAIEIEEREVPNLDYNLVLAYIGETLMQSKLTPYFEQKRDMKGSCTELEFWKHPLIANSTRENVVLAMRTQRPAEDASQNPSAGILNLPSLAIRLAGQARRAITSVSKWQSAMLPQPSKIPLSSTQAESLGTVIDVKLRPKGSSGGSITSILSTLPPPESSKNPTLSLLQTQRTPSEESAFAQKQYALPQGDILHARMLSADRWLALLKLPSEGRSVLLMCDARRYHERPYGDWTREVHLFAEDASFEPTRFVVGGRTGKMVCVVFGANDQDWKVFDLERSGVVVQKDDNDDDG